MTIPSLLAKLPPPLRQLKRRTILIAVLTLLVVIALILRFLTPKSLPSTSVTAPVVDNPLFPAVKPITTEHLNFNLSPFTPPQKLTVYSADNSLSASSLISTLTQKYSLSPVGELSNYWVSADQNTSLSFSAITNILSLSDQNPLNALGSADKTAALTAASDFLKSLNLQYLQASIQDVTYLQGGDEPSPTTDISAAQLYQVTFHLSVDNFPIVFNPKIITPATIFLNSDLQVVKAIFTSANLNLSPLGNNSPLSVEQAVTNIKANQYTFYDYTDRRGFAFEPKYNHELFFTEVSLVYLYLPQQNQLLPYYHFSGTIRFDEPTSIGTVAILTPAIGQ